MHTVREAVRKIIDELRAQIEASKKKLVKRATRKK
jgi:hypothetical protein